MDLNLKGRVAFVTGANRGIGAAIARALAREGVNLGLFVRNVDDCEKQVAAELRSTTGVKVSVSFIDFQRPDTMPPAVEQAVAFHGGVDILVNSAGGAVRGHFHEVADRTWEECFMVKPLGLIRFTRTVLPHLEKSAQGRIINLAGTRGREPTDFSAVAGPINMGTLSLTKLMANELGPKGITVNAINPGSTKGRRLDNLIQVLARERNITPKEAEAHIVDEVPMGRAVWAEDVADLAVFLASARAGMISGSAINVDGGRSRSI
jgi:NAD(P)-dependent dehydrogenase (short-subunit alcohol dehydrogenase family)